MTVRRRDAGGHEVVSFETRDAEQGEVPPSGVVLIHGVGVSSRYFAAVEDALSRDAVVLAPELVGFGRSPDDAPTLTVAEHAAVLADLLDAALPEHGVAEPPLLVGHSMGAQVATELAVRRPDLCGGLVLLGPVVDPAAPSPAAQGVRLLRDALREPWSGVVVQVRASLRTGPLRYLRTVREMCAYRLHERVDQVAAPVVVVRGTRDPVATPAFARLLAGRARDGTLVEVPGAAHLVQWSHPHEVVRVCRGELRRQRC